ncbi:MAG: dockerin type I domain-containing protein [Pirellulaceae bacterium]|nr:dockerin type I domain-containing protein [Pirellulaceae bacterium]
MKSTRPTQGPDSAVVRPRSLRFEVLEDRWLLSALAEEQHFVYLLNRARHDPAAYQREANLTVDLSTVAPRAPLAVNDHLLQSAGRRSDEMAQHDYLGHQSPVTGAWANRVAREQGYPLPSAWSNDNNYIESIAAGDWFGSADEPLEALIVDQGLPGADHRRHLLGVDAFYAENREIGVGYAAEADSTYGHYWTVHIARQEPPGMFLTGVVSEDRNGNGRYDAGEGLPGVTVQANGRAARTNDAGGYSLAVSANGWHRVLASGPGLTVPVTGSVLVAGANVEVDIVSGVRGVYLDFADKPTSAWTNPRERSDVSDNAVVDPMDALQVIDQLNTTGPAQLALPEQPDKIQPPLLDVDGDGHVLPQDALFVINYLNRTNNSGEGEGDETSGGEPPGWLPAGSGMTSAFAPCETAVSDHLQTDCLKRYLAVGYPFLVWPAAREQLADHFTARLPAASATEQADLADELTVLGDSDSGGQLDCEAPPAGRFAFWA